MASNSFDFEENMKNFVFRKSQIENFEHLFMFIHPSDGFDDWRSFLIGTLEPGGEYSSFLNDTVNLINEIIDYNFLISPNTSFTESFLTETLVELINKIMNFTNIQQTEKTNLIKFIKRAQVLIPWAALNDRIELFDPFYKLIDIKTPFMKYISKGKEIQELNEYFINHEFLTLVSLRISKNKDIPITFDHINLFFKLMDNFSKMPDTTQTNLFLTVNPIFAEMLKSFDLTANFQSFHCDKFLETLQIFIKSTEIILDEATNIVLTTSLDLGLSLLKIDGYDKQNLGASILKLFSSSKERTVKESFFNFMKNKNFVADLMERDLHYEILEAILPVFKNLVSPKQANQKDLIQILHATAKVNNDQQQIFFNLILDSIKNYNIKESISFFTNISPLATQNENKTQFYNESIIFIKFAVLTLLKQKNCSHEFVLFLIDQIVENASIHPDQNEVKEIVKPLCEKNVSQDIKYPLLKKCKMKFEQSYSPFLISILTQLFNSNKNQKDLIDFNDAFFEILQKHLLSTTDKSFLYELFAKLLHIQHKKITNNMMNSILNDSKTDMLWNFLSQVIDNDGKNAFENDSFETLKKFVSDYSEIESHFYLEFLNKIMIIVNLDAGNLKEKSISTSSGKSKNNDKKKFILIKAPLIFEQKLLTVIDSHDKLFSTCKSILINLIKNCEPPFLSVTHLYDILNEKEKSINLKEEKGKFVIFQYLRLIKSFCKKSGNLEKNRILPHNFKLSTEQYSYISKFSVSIINDPEKISFDITLQSDTPIALLILTLSPNLLYPLDRYVIKLDGKDIFSSSTVRYSKNIQKIEITLLDQENKDYSKDTTYLLLKKGFTKKLLKYFEVASFEKEESQKSEKEIKNNNRFIKLLLILLNMLPNDEELQISSSNPKPFLTNLSKCKNTYQVLYMIQVLNWRLFSDKYLELYKKDDILLKTLIKMCNKNSKCFSKSAEDFLQLFQRLNCINSNDSVLPLLHMISMKDLDENNKSLYVRYLTKYKSDISIVFSNNTDLLGDVIENINENNFETLWPYISKVKEFNSIYEMALSRLQKQTSKNIQFFTKIFFYYLSRISTNDVEKQLNSCFQLLDDSSMADTQSPIGIVSAMKTLIDKNISKLASASNLINKLFILIRSGYPQEAQRMLYTIVCSLSDISQENKVSLISFIDNISSLNIEKWNILPDDEQTNLVTIKHKGLRNLGSTCYMNSVLQQFFNIQAFDYLLATTNKEIKNNDHSYQLLQKLFCSLTMTKRSSCDTKNFFDNWSQNHTHALPSEQHDATEFMQFFLSDMPESISSLYTGKITNFIESEDHSFKTQIDEHFISIPISIDKYKSVEESLKSILNPQKLFGNNQYTKPDGVKVDAKSYQKINDSPPVLIIQLARFKFNQTTKMREKINSRFEIANEINISDILINKKNSYSSYTLNGVVVHRGDGNHGHYISYIKNRDSNPSSNKNWLRFDDMDVTESDQKDFENEAFGSNFNQQGQFNELNNMSAYILFYVADKSSIEISSKLENKSSKSTKKSKSKITIQILGDDKIEYPKEIINEVTKENESYLIEKSAFSTPTFEFILEEANPIQLRDFFFNVFCHSSTKGKLVASFEEHMNYIVENDEDNSDLIEWLTKNINLIISIFINSNSNEITKSVYNIITKSISKSSVEKGGKLVSLFVLYLHSCLEAWRQVFNISSVVLSYLKLKEKNILFAINEKWTENLIKFVMETYNGERQDYFLQNINISPIFESLSILIQKDLNVELFKPLLSIHQQIQKSPSLKNYRSLIVYCASSEIFPIEDVVNIFPNELKDSNIMEIKFGKLNDQTDLGEINNSLRSANISQSSIIDFICDNKIKFKNYLIMKQNMNYFYDLFLLNPNKIENLITDNLKDEEDQQILLPFFEFIRNKMEEISKKDNQGTILSFLRIVLFLMKKINYPHDKNLEELKFFIKYQNKTEFIQISSYVGNPIILSIYDQKFPSPKATTNKEEKKFNIKSIFTINKTSNNEKLINNNNNFSASDFFDIIRSILSSSDVVVDQFLNKPNLYDVVLKSVSKISNESEIELMVKFIEFLKNKKNKYQNKVAHIIYAIISGNNTNVSYIIGISKYFHEIFEDLNFQEIANMLIIVDAILKSGSNEQNDFALSLFITPIFNYLMDDKICFSDADTFLLRLNPKYIGTYLSDKTSVVSMIIQLVTRMASLNINFRKECDKAFQTRIFYANKTDGSAYYCATFLTHFCFIDKKKSVNDIVNCLKDTSKNLERISNDKWRNLYFKSLFDLIQRDSVNVPDWAKLLVEGIFKLASLSCDHEKIFFETVLKAMNDKEFPKFILNYSKSFSPDYYKLLWPDLYQKTMAINQLKQLAFLIRLFPDSRDSIIQFIEIEKDWFKSKEYQEYKKLILPNDK